MLWVASIRALLTSVGVISHLEISTSVSVKPSVLRIRATNITNWAVSLLSVFTDDIKQYKLTSKLVFTNLFFSNIYYISHIYLYKSHEPSLTLISLINDVGCLALLKGGLGLVRLLLLRLLFQFRGGWLIGWLCNRYVILMDLSPPRLPDKTQDTRLQGQGNLKVLTTEPTNSFQS